ncbi:Calcineurin-like phosphoesterase [Globisporangium polare]
MKLSHSLFLGMLAIATAAFAPASTVNAVITRNVTAIVDVIAFADVYEMLQDSVNGLNYGGPSRVVPIVKEMQDPSKGLYWSDQLEAAKAQVELL